MEGLRTLVIAQKVLSEESFADFSQRLKTARAILDNSKEQRIEEVIHSLESDMEYLAVTGVEDKLQENVL